jgi:hypothetical protein
MWSPFLTRGGAAQPALLPIIPAAPRLCHALCARIFSAAYLEPVARRDGGFAAHFLAVAPRDELALVGSAG